MMQYITLRQVLDDFIITLDGDDYASNASDVAIRNFALRGIRELGFDVSKRIKSLKLSINSTNDTVALPDDFVDLIKIGVVDDDGLLYVFGQNKNLNYSRAYSTGNTTTDSAAGPLNIDDNIILDREDSKSATGGVTTDGSEVTNEFDSYIFRNYVYNNSLGRLYGIGGGQHQGEYRLNLDQQRIEINTSSGLSEVVIEYIADESRSTNPLVHVYLEEALRAYMYYKLVERKSTVPANEKARARSEYYNERRKANARMSNFTKEEALKVIRKNFKQAPKH
jgi:hypothetical protein